MRETFWNGVGRLAIKAGDMVLDRLITRKGLACLTPWAVVTYLLREAIARDLWILGFYLGFTLMLVWTYMGFKLGEIKVSKTGFEARSETVADGVPGNAPKSPEENGGTDEPEPKA